MEKELQKLCKKKEKKYKRIINILPRMRVLRFDDKIAEYDLYIGEEGSRPKMDFTWIRVKDATGRDIKSAIKIGEPEEETPEELENKVKLVKALK